MIRAVSTGGIPDRRGEFTAGLADDREVVPRPGLDPRPAEPSSDTLYRIISCPLGGSSPSLKRRRAAPVRPAWQGGLACRYHGQSSYPAHDVHQRQRPGPRVRPSSDPAVGVAVPLRTRPALGGRRGRRRRVLAACRSQIVPHAVGVESGRICRGSAVRAALTSGALPLLS